MNPNHETHPTPAREPTALRLRLGTRASALARWQADWVRARLTEFGFTVELVFLSTQGDVSARPLGAIGGSGVFTKEIQRALLGGEIDLAVHSLKDLPTEPVAGLTLTAVPPRESTADVLVSASGRLGRSQCELPLGPESTQQDITCPQNSAGNAINALPAGALIGTGSVRRRAQLLHFRSDLQVLDIRGNVDTRLRKLDEGQYDAVILAEAGLRRLGLTERITQVIPRQVMLPAVGQGALGVETRADAAAVVQAVARLDHPETRAAVMAERALLAALRGGCLAPVAAWGRVADGNLLLDAVVLDGCGSRRLWAARRGAPAAAESLGRETAEELLAAGAAELIAAARGPR